MESVKENRGLFYCLLFTAAFTIALAAEVDPTWNASLQLVPWPNEMVCMLYGDRPG